MSDIDEAKSGPKPRAPPDRLLEGGVAEVVVGGALLRVLQDLVGLVQLLEAHLGAVVAGIAVGMEFLGEPPVSGLELLLVGAPGKPERLVVVALGHVSAGPSVSCTGENAL